MKPKKSGRRAQYKTMRRHRKEISFSDSEIGCLTDTAHAAGLTPSGMLRHIVVHHVLPRQRRRASPVPVEDRQLYVELAPLSHGLSELAESMQSSVAELRRSAWQGCTSNDGETTLSKASLLLRECLEKVEKVRVEVAKLRLHVRADLNLTHPTDLNLTRG